MAPSDPVTIGRAGFSVERAYDQGVVRLELPIEPTQEFVLAVEQRDHLAERRSIEALLGPGSVVVVGASAEDLPELAELDLNPVVATPEESLVLDVKVRLVVPPRRPDPWLRSLQ
jgi:ATP-grasp domain